MATIRSAWIRYGSTTAFVFLWSSGAIFSRFGLDHASVFIFLVMRFTLACAVLALFALVRRTSWLPAPGTRVRVTLTGLLMIGGYSSCYFLALAYGVTPGILATILATQPVLTLMLLERRSAPRRLVGLTLAFIGLVLVVYQSMGRARLSSWGPVFALGALTCTTTGVILQKRLNQPPAQVLPLQYVASGVLCVALVPSQPFYLDYGVALLIPVLYLGILISVVGQLLLYHLIQRGNLVNVTSLLYLVPVATAGLDYVFLGHRLSPLSLVGMLAIVLGLIIVFRRGRAPAPAAVK